jgi:hypothetical protein
VARDKRPWPYSIGRRAVNCVRVYSREHSGICQIEWYDDRGRVQRSLRTYPGEAIPDTEEGRTLARDIAEALSEEQEKDRTRVARARLFGVTSQHSLKALLDKMHEHREHGWSEGHARDQARYRKFWLAELGEDMPLARANRMPLVAIVERAGAKATRPWSMRTKQAVLRYLRDAYGFGRKVGMVDDRSDLHALDIPSPKGKRGKSYTKEQAFALIEALWARDPRAWLVAESYYQAGRRLNATRNLRVSDVRFDTVTLDSGEVLESAIVTYAAEHDKKGTTSVAVFVGTALERVRELIAKPLVQRTGLLLPHGDLDKRGQGEGRPIAKKTLNDILLDAEKDAGIEHVKHRSYHGMKRRFAGMSKRMREVAAQQSNTSEAMLAGTYDPEDDIPAQAELARELDRARGTK